jgi:hypothetical protein
MRSPGARPPSAVLPMGLSTLADQVGGCTTLLAQANEVIE